MTATSACCRGSDDSESTAAWTANPPSGQPASARPSTTRRPLTPSAATGVGSATRTNSSRAVPAPRPASAQPASSAHSRTVHRPPELDLAAPSSPRPRRPLSAPLRRKANHSPHASPRAWSNLSAADEWAELTNGGVAVDAIVKPKRYANPYPPEGARRTWAKALQLVLGAEGGLGG